MSEKPATGSTKESGLDESSDDDEIQILSSSSSASCSTDSNATESMTMLFQAARAGLDVKSLFRLFTQESSDLSPGLLSHFWLDLADLMPSPRERLQRFSSVDDVVSLIRSSSKIVVLTGAGISVSCGIPDFRGKGGIYSTIKEKYPNITDPQLLFDISFFRSDPKPFFNFAKEIYPENFQPSLTHRFIRSLEENGKLLRNYTQNIDSLEKSAGIERVVYCHGSFATASCMICQWKVSIDEIKQDIMAGQTPRCKYCSGTTRRAIMKPDIVFFGEGLPTVYEQNLVADEEEVDLLLVVGSSLKVGPVNRIPRSIPKWVPQVLINREPLNNFVFDVELLGDCDVIFNELALRLGEPYSKLCKSGDRLMEMTAPEANGPSEESYPSTSSAGLKLNGGTSLEAKRKLKSENRCTIPDGYFAYRPPNRYLFHGADIK